MAAVLDLVEDRGIEGLGVGAVCERAAVSKRDFYDEFRTMDDLAGRTLSSVLDDLAEHVGSGTADSIDVDAAESARIIEAAVDSVLSVFEDRRVASLYLGAPGNAGLREARDSAVRAFVEQLLVVLVPEQAASPAARLSAHVLVAGTTDVVAMWLKGDLDITRNDLVSTLVRLGVGALEQISSKH